MKRNFILFLLLAILTFSCKKEGDDEYPVIEVLSPQNNIQVDVYDTLHISLHITDNAGLSYLDVKLLSLQMTPVLPSIYTTLEGKTYNGTFDYVIDNFRLESGAYYLSIEVSDGQNLKRIYVNINVTGIPKRLNGFFAATIPSPGNLSVYKSDTAWMPTLFSTTPSDFTDMAVSSYWQQVYVNGSYSGNLVASSIDGATSGFSVPAIVGSAPFWGPMSITDSRLWIAYRGLNQFKSLDQNGATTYTATTDNGFYPRRSFQLANRIFTEQKDVSSSAVRMVVFSVAGGSLQETPMSVDVIEMFEKDVDNIYVVGNGAGQGHLLIYDYVSNGFWEPIILPTGTVNSASQIDSNSLLIGMSNGTVYKFTYLPVGLLTWTSGITPSQIRFDEVGGRVFTAEGNNVKIYNYAPFSNLQTIPFANAISDLELWFNK